MVMLHVGVAVVIAVATGVIGFVVVGIRIKVDDGVDGVAVSAFDDMCEGNDVGNYWCGCVYNCCYR